VLLTISTTEPSATDLGYLLHKHPDRFQTFDQSFGRVHVFFPEATEERCTAAVLLDVDPIGLARGAAAGRPDAASLGHYVNDRPYVASSLLSVALSRVFGTALGGRCALRPELPSQPRRLVARLDVLPIHGGEEFLRRVFEPLGYTVEAKRHPLDETFPDWGASRYYSVMLSAVTTLSQLLTHLYVLVPVFDNTKHYFVGDDETEKLIAKGEGWLEQHPAKTEIARRYLKNRPSLYREALARLVGTIDTDESESTLGDVPQPLEKLREPSLNEQRHGNVMAVLKASGARSVIDLGCSEGRFLKRLIEDSQFERIAGFDVSVMALERAAKRLHYDRLSERQRQRLELWHGSLMYRDSRLSGFDAAVVIEVIEHFDPPRLAAFERVVFGEAQSKTVILTTPNREYNSQWESLPAGSMRHADHRFEWTRKEFQAWSERIAQRYRYSVRFLPVGPEDPVVGSPTQMAVFTLQPSPDAV
jgi:3' terminal RNA ribose 2'-O-methyltransferase Hen1